MTKFLGKNTTYPDSYNNKLLEPIPRALARNSLTVKHNLQCCGYDLWNCYEVSWLGKGNKPEVRILEFIIKASSPNIVESKSVKLYLNSFNNSRFNDENEVSDLIKQDLNAATDSEVIVNLKSLNAYQNSLKSFSGTNLDMIDVDIKCFDLELNKPELESDQIVSEVLYSHLLKSNCLVTQQPDWADIQISYQGPQIKHASLLKYIISYRNHNGFHEECVERIFHDIASFCRPTELSVYARYTRRGGIDINPWRSSLDIIPNLIDNNRKLRQ